MSADQAIPAPPVTRLAPSPTGALHLGNLRTFLINFAHARQTDARILLRIEDLDSPRVKAGADRGAIELMTWMGFTWDEGPFYQAHDLSPYETALAALHAAGHVYPCALTRKDIAAAASAPNGDVFEARYQSESRHRQNPQGLPPRLGVESDDNTRLLVPDESTELHDGFAGRHPLNVQAMVGDFVVATKAGYPSYQLAVVVDDARQGVTQIIRGDDLLGSAHRQIWLRRFLKMSEPEQWHVPLVIGTDGRRLAKRHGDSRVATYRAAGATPERLIGLMAAWSGLLPREAPVPMALSAFVDGFDWAALPRDPVIFTETDDRYLYGKS